MTGRKNTPARAQGMVFTKLESSVVFLNYRKSALQESERGSALVEFAITLPFLIFLTTMLVQFGFLLEDYMHVVNITREATRQAVQVANHEENQECIVAFEDASGCPGNNIFIPHMRARYLMQQFAANMDATTLVTRSFLTSDGSLGGSDQTVQFEVTGEFVGFMGVRIPIQQEARGGYSWLNYSGAPVDEDEDSNPGYQWPKEIIDGWKQGVESDDYSLTLIEEGGDERHILAVETVLTDIRG